MFAIKLVHIKIYDMIPGISQTATPWTGLLPPGMVNKYFSIRYIVTLSIPSLFYIFPVLFNCIRYYYFRQLILNNDLITMTVYKILKPTIPSNKETNWQW